MMTVPVSRRATPSGDSSTGVPAAQPTVADLLIATSLQKQAKENKYQEPKSTKTFADLKLVVNK